MHISPRRSGTSLAATIAIVLTQSLAAAQSVSGDANRHYDARIELNQTLPQQRFVRPQLQTSQVLNANIEELTIEPDSNSGVVRSLSNQGGFLTEASPGDARQLGLKFVRENLAALGLSASDLADYMVTDVVRSKVTGATRIYLQQRYQTIPVYNAQLQINVNRDGRIISVNNSF